MKGPGEASLKMLNALLGAKTCSSRKWDTILGDGLIPPDKAGPEREPALLQEYGCTVIAMVGSQGTLHELL